MYPSIVMKFLLLLLFIGGMEAKDSSEENCFKDKNRYNPALVDMTEHFFSVWEKSQVFIYEKPITTLNKDPYPNCFGSLLTSDRVLTTVSCFKNVEEIRNFYKMRDPKMKIEGNWLSKIVIKAANKINDLLDPSKFIVALVHYKHSF